MRARATVQLAALVVLLTGAAQSRADPPADRAAVDGDERVRRVELDWHALDVGPDVQPGEARVYTRTLTSADVGAWFAPPPGSFEPVIGVAGGDVGLLPRLSLRLVGAQDLVADSSGMIAGLELWLLPRSTPWRLNILGGYQEEMSRARALWSELVSAYQRGPLQIGVSVRQHAILGGSSVDTTTAAGAAYQLDTYRIGLEYVTASSAGGARTVLVPSVSTKVARDKVTLRGSASFGIRGTATTPARVSVAGAF